MQPTSYDVVIIGAGFAGLTLARQLLMRRNDLTILHLEKKDPLPGPRQKVGESNVQVQGYYLGKVLDLEEYLFHEHLMKYNLRFYWRTPGTDGGSYTDFSQSYIRTFSNIPCYQLDRNKIETDLATMNRTHAGYTLLEGVSRVEPELGADGADHTVRFQHAGAAHTVRARWLVDSSGRNRKLAGVLGTRKKGPLPHSASFFWVDGTVNIEKLGQGDNARRRLHPSRGALGHLPAWLATNHFMGKGFWFWVIPLQGRTSFGLVYDHNVVDPETVNKPEKLRAWLFERFPLFREALDEVPWIDFTVMHHYSHDCGRTLDRNRFAMTGEAGRFTDPLYSPGGDLIAIHNTLITACILEPDATRLPGRVSNYETMFQVFYQGFLPSYHPGYLTLGDQEVFVMKYTWELAVYFAMYVFPFINDLLTERHFLPAYFRRLAMLGDCNRKLMNHLRAYCEWKAERPEQAHDPRFFDFTELTALREAEKTFYKVGLKPKQAVAVLDAQLTHLTEMCRYFIAHMDAVMTGLPHLRHSSTHVASIDMKQVDFSPEHLAAAAAVPLDDPPHVWALDADLLQRHFAADAAAAEPVAAS